MLGLFDTSSDTFIASGFTSLKEAFDYLDYLSFTGVNTDAFLVKYIKTS